MDQLFFLPATLPTSSQQAWSEMIIVLSDLLKPPKKGWPSPLPLVFVGPSVLNGVELAVTGRWN